MKKVIKIVLVIALIALIMIQFVRPVKNNGGYESVAVFEKETKVSPRTASILKQQCYDCHSDQTQYPWYAEFAPASFWLEDHISHGKGHLNFSAWESYSVKKKEHKLEEVIEMVEEGEMPLESFTWIHGDLPEEDKQLLLQWAALSRLQYQKEINLGSK